MPKHPLSSPHLTAVREQYEDYPYPKRDPNDEKKRLYAPHYDSLDLINYYCFEGKRDFTESFSVLVAGGGTGDAVIYLAEQLRHTNARIVYVDLSKASQRIARERAKIRGLTNITWVHDSLLSIPDLALGSFDYINCCGVLHHLENPSAGLSALSRVLKPEGAMNIMVYAKYGRTGIYPMQALMRMLTKHITNPQEKVDLCKQVLNQLPKSNWFMLSAGQFRHEIEVLGDIGIYDLLLHSQDRAYSVPELYEWVEGNGLCIVDLLAFEGRAKTLYDPKSYIKNPALLSKIEQASKENKHAIAEILAGHLITHTCYLAHSPKQKPSPENTELIPSFASTYAEPAHFDALRHLLKMQNPSQQQGNFHLPGANNHYISFKATKNALDLFCLIDGNRTTDEILTQIDAPYPELLSQFCALFHALNQEDWLILRHPASPKCKTIQELQTALTTRLSKHPLYSAKKKS